MESQSRAATRQSSYPRTVVHASNFTTPPDLDNLLNRLDGVRQTAPNKYQAKCPAHDDRSPSLAIKCSDGAILIKCFAGCDTAQILANVGLTFNDLFPCKTARDFDQTKPRPKPPRFNKADEQNRQLEIKLAHEAAAKNAELIIEQSKPVNNHPYLKRKGIQAHGARLYHGRLVISINDINGKLVNVQFIAADGAKRFLKGGQKKGCFAQIGKPATDQPILICEGFATGASLHGVTGHFVVIALDAGNLELVAVSIRKRYPEAKIIIAGDNDLSGTGQKAARAAAMAIGGEYLLPPEVDTDWNDYFNKGGV